MIRTILKAGAAVLVLVAFGVAIAVSTRTPSLDRNWDEDVRVLSGVQVIDGGALVLEDIRNWSYTETEITSKEYRPYAFDPLEIESMWLYEQELGLGGRIAHTFLVFQFPESYGDHRWVGISVETRREVGETYSIIGGMMRSFEVTHIWATEEDLVRRRVQYLDYPLTRYRVSVRRDHIASVFRQLVYETEALHVEPRWYHTLSTNCTNSLIEYVNTVQPETIPWHYSFVLTGRTDEYLAELGFVDLESRVDITREWLAANPLR